MPLDHPVLPRLYDELASLWPLISPRADHAAEADALRRTLDEHLPAERRAGRPTILELGAGGGHALSHLTNSFNAVAVDLSESMLVHCRRLNRNVPTHVGDMRTVRLRRTFDAVIAHDAIDYMISIEDLRAACTTAAAHLDIGGVFLAAPTYIEETFREFETVQDSSRDQDTDVAHVSFVHQTGSTTYELVTTLIIRCDGTLCIEEDRHACGLFPRAQWIDALKYAGFDVHDTTSTTEHDPHVLFVGVRTEATT